MAEPRLFDGIDLRRFLSSLDGDARRSLKVPRVSEGALALCFRRRTITASVSFVGDARLFDFRPSRHTRFPPYGRLADKSRLALSFPFNDEASNETERLLRADIRAIKRWLEWVRQEVEAFSQEAEV